MKQHPDGSLEQRICETIKNRVKELNRSDLFREPVVGFSSALDAGFYELKNIIGPWHRLPSDFVPGAASVISYYVPFTKALAEEPLKAEVVSEKWSEAYLVINEHFNVINAALCDLLKAEGHDAAPIPSTHTYDKADIHCIWSHRSAGVIAGLGSFGANNLVITDKGSAVRFCTVITSAVLEPYGGSSVERCLRKQGKACSLCYDICPVDALSDGEFKKFTCQDHLDENEQVFGADVCGKCISVCPLAYIE